MEQKHCHIYYDKTRVPDIAGWIMGKTMQMQSPCCETPGNPVGGSSPYKTKGYIQSCVTWVGL